MKLNFLISFSFLMLNPHKILLADDEPVLIKSLFQAVRNNNLTQLDWILSKDVNVNFLKFKRYSFHLGGKIHYTALMEAAYYGHLDCVKKLIENGANPNIKNDFNQTALLLGLKLERWEVVKYFLELKGDLQLDLDVIERKSHQSPLGYLIWLSITGEDSLTQKVWNDHFFQMAILLIQKGASLYHLLLNESDLESLRQKSPETLFHLEKYLVEYEEKALAMAAKNGELTLVKWLVKMGFDVNKEIRFPQSMETAFSFAVKEGETEVVKYFLEWEKTTQQNLIFKEKALSYALKNQNFEVAEILLGQTNIDKQNIFNQYWSESNNEVIAFLLNLKETWEVNTSQLKDALKNNEWSLLAMAFEKDPRLKNRLSAEYGDIILSNDVEKFQFFLEQNIPMTDQTFLLQAIDKSYYPLVNLYIEECPEEREFFYEKFEEVLLSGSHSTIQFFLEWGYKLKNDYILLKVVENNDVKTLELYLQKYPETKDLFPEILHGAIMDHKWDLAEVLIMAHVSLLEERKALIQLVSAKQSHLLELLLKNYRLSQYLVTDYTFFKDGADVTEKSHFYLSKANLAYLSVYYDDEKTLGLFVKFGLDLNGVAEKWIKSQSAYNDKIFYKKDEATLLSLAVEKNNMKLVQLLMEAGSVVERHSLKKAIMLESTEMVALLLEKEFVPTSELIQLAKTRDMFDLLSAHLSGFSWFVEYFKWQVAIF